MIKRTLRFSMPDGVALVADAWGDPGDPPVLFAHGGGQTRHAWGRTAEEVARHGWYAIAYDQRGHGDSGWSPEGRYPIDCFAADQTIVARALHQRPVLVGASLGGLAAMLAQGENPQPIYAALVLVDITPKVSPGVQKIVGFMSEHAEEGFSTPEEAARIIAEYTGRPRRTGVGGLDKNLRRRENGRYYWHWDPKFMRGTDEEPKRAEPERAVRATRNLRLPTLLIRGRMSEVVTEELAREFLELVPHSIYVEVENARHMVAGDRNDIFTRAVVEFLQSLR